MVFHLSGFLSVSLNPRHLRKPLYTDCKEMVFHLSVFLSVPSKDLLFMFKAMVVLGMAETVQGDVLKERHYVRAKFSKLVFVYL